MNEEYRCLKPVHASRVHENHCACIEAPIKGTGTLVVHWVYRHWIACMRIYYLGVSTLCRNIEGNIWQRVSYTHQTTTVEGSAEVSLFFALDVHILYMYIFYLVLYSWQRAEKIKACIKRRWYVCEYTEHCSVWVLPMLWELQLPPVRHVLRHEPLCMHFEI